MAIGREPARDGPRETDPLHMTQSLVAMESNKELR